jgi:type VI protein secretion system component VasK
MLIPQFSLRWMLAVVTVLAVVFLIVSRAAQGSAWAVGVSAAVMMVAFVAVVHLGLFFLVWLVSLFSVRRQARSTSMRMAAPRAASPFQAAEAVAPAEGSNHQPPA